MSIRVRFAPSPTGQVHIGNIRTAIFNYLYARHNGGEFILRIEDTDLERSTPEAIEKLYECMQYLGLDYDGTVMYQSQQSEHHIAAANKLLAEGKAYYGKPDENGKCAVFFQIPLDFANTPVIRQVGEAELSLHAETPIALSSAGVVFSALSSKGKPMPAGSCLAGLKDGKYYDAEGKLLFDTVANYDAIISGESFTITGASVVKFTRHEVTYTDLIKGEMAKPLDGIKDQIIVRGDGSPIFHLANVIDDIAQEVTHIVRGDDHVENTYRHVMLFSALGAKIPFYAHMPMIVNASGKPYSKRDGDAFVGDFRDKGFLAPALFNYLSLLGWSPGDDREKMTKAELIEAFTFERVKSSAAQLDMHKLMNLNGLYIAELEANEFIKMAFEFFTAGSDFKVDLEKFAPVAKLMQSRTKVMSQVCSWQYFFDGNFEYDEKNCNKHFKNEQVINALKSAVVDFGNLDSFTPEAIKAEIEKLETKFEFGHGKLFQPMRLATTSVNGGADLDVTLSLIGQAAVIERLNRTLATFA